MLFYSFSSFRQGQLEGWLLNGIWLYSFCHFDNRNSSESFISDGDACPNEKTRSTVFPWWHISLDFWLIVCMRKEKMSWRRWKCCGWDRIPVILSFQKALPAGANRKMEFSFQAGFWITIGDIGENNRRYFQNTRTFLVNAYFFSGKCLLLSTKMPASFRKKSGFSTSEARLSGSKSLRLAFFFSPNIGNGQGLCYKKRMFAFFLHRYSANGWHLVDCSERTVGFVVRNGN